MQHTVHETHKLKVMSFISSRVNHPESVRILSLTTMISRSRSATTQRSLSVEVMKNDLMTSEGVHLRCGGQCYMGFVANLVLFLAVKKIVKIGWVLAKPQQVKYCAFFRETVYRACCDEWLKAWNGFWIHDRKCHLGASLTGRWARLWRSARC